MKSRGFSVPRLLGAVLIALVAGAVGFYAYRVWTPAPTSSTDIRPIKDDFVRPKPVPKDAALPTETAQKKPIPDTLPDITLADKDGKPTKLASFGGRPLMVNFWATWCAPCRREIPLLNKIRMERKVQNVEIVGVAVDFKEDVLKFLQKTPLSYPLLIGEEDGLAAADAFGVGMAFPASVFVDSKNRILTVKIGELHEDEANFAFDRLKDIDNGVLTRQAAQMAVRDAFSKMAAERAKLESETPPTAAK